MKGNTTAQVIKVNEGSSSPSLKVETFLKSIRRKSVGTAKTYTTGLNHLSNFIKASYPDYDTDSIIDAMLENKINVYQLLDSFISYNQSKKE